jgi:hypothetical protein
MDVPDRRSKFLEYSGEYLVYEKFTRNSSFIIFKLPPLGVFIFAVAENKISQIFAV